MYSFHKYAEYVLFVFSVTFCPEKYFYFRAVSIQEANVLQYCPTSYCIQYLSDFKALLGIRKNLYFFDCFELCLQSLLTQTPVKPLIMFGCHSQQISFDHICIF